jgi:WD40 repeat protein
VKKLGGMVTRDEKPRASRSSRRFKGHTETIWGVAFSTDDRHAISGSGDGTLRLWRLPDPPQAKAQRSGTRY